MEDEKINIQYENNVFKFKILYLIRTNLPKSEYIYIITFLIKYIGLILFSTSLNEWNTDQTEDNINNKGNINQNNKSSDIPTLFSVQHFFDNFLITGHHFKVLASFYEIICLLVFCFFIIMIKEEKHYFILSVLFLKELLCCLEVLFIITAVKNRN